MTKISVTTDPLAAIGALGGAICHIHAKDTMIHTPVAALISRLAVQRHAARGW